MSTISLPADKVAEVKERGLLMRAYVPVFTGTCQTCKGVVAAAVKDSQLSDWVSRGLDIDVVRGPVKVPGCSCPKSEAVAL